MFVSPRAPPAQPETDDLLRHGTKTYSQTSSTMGEAGIAPGSVFVAPVWERWNAPRKLNDAHSSS